MLILKICKWVKLIKNICCPAFDHFWSWLPHILLPHYQAQAAGQGAADEPPAPQLIPADPPAQNEAEPEPPDAPPEHADDPELEEEEGAAAEDADPNNGAQG